MPIKTINIVVGGRFHASQLYFSLSDAGYDVKIYSSSPKRYFKNIPSDRVTFVPKVIQIIQKVLKRRMPRLLNELNALAFDWFISKIMRPADLLWGFNGDSLYCGLKIQATGGTYIVDRACPHFEVQEALLINESKKIVYPYARFSSRMRKRFAREYDVADAIVVPSNYSMKSFKGKGVAESKVHVIPLDANLSPVLSGNKPSKKVVSADENSIFRIGLVGGSFLRKGIIYLLRAIKLLNRPDVVLYIRATKNNITQHAEAQRLCEELNVVFVPYLDDINDFYRSLDVFILPSIDEGFGMVVYEALRNGTPVLASANVGAIDGLTENTEVVIFPAGDEYALAEKINKVYSDRGFLLSLGQSGFEFYKNKMDDGINYQRNLQHLIEQY